MRATTEAQMAALSGTSRTTRARVEIDRGGLAGPEDWVDMSALSGINWVRSVKIRRSVEDQITSATIVLHSRRYQRSIVPLVNSPENAGGTICSPPNPIRVYVSVTGLHAPADWVLLFDGLIDRPTWGGESVSLKCSDWGVRLSRRDTITPRKYPSDPLFAQPAEDLIQSILDDALGSGDVTLWSQNGTVGTPFNPADSPGFLLQEYVQDRQPIIQGVLKVSTEAFGWRVGYRWQENAGGYRFQLWDPGRELPAIGTATITSDNIVGSLTINTTTLSSGTDWATGLGSMDLAALAVRDAINGDATLQGEVVAAASLAEPAVGTATFAGQPFFWQTITINTTTYTVGVDFIQGPTVEDTIDNLIGAIRANDPGVSRVWKRGTDRLKIKWGTAGSSGNSIVFTSTLSNVSLDGGGTLGGSKAGLDARVVVQWLTRGEAGNSVVFTESVTDMTMDGSGTLGGTQAGRDLTVDQTFDQGPTAGEAGTPIYYEIRDVGQDIADVRTVCDGTYTPRAVQNEPYQRATVIVQASAALRAKYEDISFSLSEDSTGPIDTEAEMRRLLESILYDTEEPWLTQTCQMPLWWPVENGDYYTFRGNGVHYSADQSLAVVSWEHSIQDGHGITTLQMRGKPSGGHRRWLKKEARKKGNDTYQHDGMADLVITPGQGSVSITVGDPQTFDPPILDWGWTELHLSTAGPSFIPTSQTRVRRGKEVGFTVTDLVPGVTYYAKALVITMAGAVGCASSFVVEASEYTAPYHEDPDQVLGMLVNPNPGLNSYTKGLDIPPDSWDVLTDANIGDSSVTFPPTDTVWGTHIEADTLTGNTGGKSIKWNTISVGQYFGFISDFFPVSDGSIYQVVTQAAVTGSPVGADFLNSMLPLYDVNKNFLRYATRSDLITNPAPGILGNPGLWRRYSQQGYDVNGSVFGQPRYAKVGIYLDTTAAAITGLWVDSVQVRRMAPSFRAFVVAAGQSIPAATWTQVQYRDDTLVINYFDHGGHYYGAGGGPPYHFQAPYDGEFSFQTYVDFSSIGAGVTYRGRWALNNAAGTTYRNTPQYSASLNDAGLIANAKYDLAAGDTVHFEIYASSAATASGSTELTGRQIVDSPSE